MHVEEPLSIGFTIYSKTDCSYCVKVKQLLMEKQIFFLEISCGDYLKEDKDLFLSFIEKRASKKYTTFPMVFKDGVFIGGFTETSAYFDKLLCFDDLEL
jgi:glutaredoxin